MQATGHKALSISNTQLKMALVLGTNCGFVTTAPTADPDTGYYTFTLDNQTNASKYTSPATAQSVTEIGWWCDNATQAADFEVGIYSHDSNNNTANLLIGKSSPTAKGTDAGWKKATVAIPITENTIYWIATQCDNTATATFCDCIYDAAYKKDRTSNGSTSLPSTWTYQDTSTRLAGFYAVWSDQPIAAGTNMQVNVDDVLKEVSAIKVNVDDVEKSVTAGKINKDDAWKTIF